MAITRITKANLKDDVENAVIEKMAELGDMSVAELRHQLAAKPLIRKKVNALVAQGMAKATEMMAAHS